MLRLEYLSTSQNRVLTLICTLTHSIFQDKHQPNQSEKLTKDIQSGINKK